MDVLITSFTYWPNANGVQRVTEYQAEGLVKLGHNVTVLTSDNYVLPAEEIHNGVKIIRLSVYKKYLWVTGNKKKAQLAIKHEAEKADIILCTCIFSFFDQWVVPLLSQFTNKKVGILHGIYETKLTSIDKTSILTMCKKVICNIRWGIYFKLHWNEIQLFDSITHLHEKDESIKYFEKRNYHNNIVLMNAVENDFFKNGLNQKTDSNKLLLQVANYAENKNQQLTLTTFYKANLPRARLVFVGGQDNHYLKKLKQCKEKLDIQYGDRRVEFYVGLSREETKELTKCAYVSILSSYSEHLPLVILEAMAAGKPFISTEVGVVPYLPGGIICSSAEEMVQALRRLYSDENLAKRLGQEGKNYALENCMIEKQVAKLNQLISELI